LLDSLLQEIRCTGTTDKKMSVTRPAHAQIIRDPQLNTRYKKGRFLGKGNFGSVYKATDVATGENVAVKIIPKMSQEIRLLKSVSHIYIVKLFSLSGQRFCVCDTGAMHSTSPEGDAPKSQNDRYFMRQILLGCQYLHVNKIIHRDLKPAKILINDEMEIKIGDFGLTTKVDRGELKKTRWHPELHASRGVREGGIQLRGRVWSLGCIRKAEENSLRHPEIHGSRGVVFFA
jgi:polo-like kinase 1